MNENTFSPFMGSWNCIFSSCSESGWWGEVVLLWGMRLQHHRFDFCTEKFFLGHETPPTLGFPPKWGSYLGQTILSPWTLIQCTLFCRGGRKWSNKWLFHSVITNSSVCGGLYDLLCFWGPSPSPHCWMSAPWFSLGSFAPRKWREEGKEKERGW